MPKISAIEPQKKRSARFNIYLDDKFTFAIDQDNLIVSHLEVGQTLTGLEVEKFIAENQIGKLLDASLRFLSYRPRSEKEVTDYLAKKIAKSENIKFHQAKESPAIEKVVAKLKKYKYLDDLEFAKWLVSSRIRSATRGLLVLKLELKSKGIDSDIIDDVLNDSIDERKIAESALIKAGKRWDKLSPLDLKKKVYQYLASRGFAYDIIKVVFANYKKKD